jgi:CRP-like cAMP-binding protein
LGGAGGGQPARPRGGLEIGKQVREVQAGRPWRDPAPSGPAPLFEALDLFRPFTPEEREGLAASMTQRLLAPGAAVMRRGEQGETLGVLSEGVLEVRIARPDGSEWVVDRLFPGAVFGEMSLLTGQPRSATILALTEAVVFELHRDHVEPVLRARPEVLDGLTAIMAQRQARNAATGAGISAPAPAAPTREDILVRLRAFFGIR